MATSDLMVYTRTEALLYRLYPALVNYPKSEKFVLCKDIKECILKMLQHISRGNSVKSKRKVYLQEADGYLQMLKALIKLSRYRRYISESFFQDLDLELTEINKLLNGYIRSS